MPGLQMTSKQFVKFLTSITKSGKGINLTSVKLETEVNNKMKSIFERAMFGDVYANSLDVWRIEDKYEMRQMLKLARVGNVTPPSGQYNKKYLAWKLKTGTPAHVLSGRLKEASSVVIEDGKVLIKINKNYEREKKIVKTKRRPITGLRNWDFSKKGFGKPKTKEDLKRYVTEEIVQKVKVDSNPLKEKWFLDKTEAAKQRAGKKGLYTVNEDWLYTHEKEKSIVKATAVFGWQEARGAILESLYNIARGV